MPACSSEPTSEGVHPRRSRLTRSIRCCKSLGLGSALGGLRFTDPGARTVTRTGLGFQARGIVNRFRL